MARGEGAVVEDVDGNVYLDCCAGIAVAATGHSHPDVVARDHRAGVALSSHLHRLLPRAAGRARRGAREHRADRRPREDVFLELRHRGGRGRDQAGAVSHQALQHHRVSRIVSRPHARLAGADVEPDRAAPRVRSDGAGVFHAPYANPYRCPLGARDAASCARACLAYIENQILTHLVSPDEVAAIVVEPIQGEGGYVVPPPEFIQGLAAIAAQHGMLLDRRRSAVGHRAHRKDVRDRACRRAARHHHRRKGHRVGAADGRDDCARGRDGLAGRARIRTRSAAIRVACAAALATIKLVRDGLMQNAADVGALSPGAARGVWRERHRADRRRARAAA